jgi:hypothetical protein
MCRPPYELVWDEKSHNEAQRGSSVPQKSVLLAASYFNVRNNNVVLRFRQYYSGGIRSWIPPMEINGLYLRQYNRIIVGL